MSVGPLTGIAASLAGSPLAQTKGSEVDRVQQEAAAGALHAAGQQKAETAAGIGQADGEDHQAAERDADGRRPWEASAPKPGAAATDENPAAAQPLTKDPTGQSGNLIDLSG